jgi:hypothetical protein
LDEAGLHAYIAEKQPELTDELIRQRLSFANGYQRWSEEDWYRVVFADESNFLGAGYHGKHWVRRPPGTAHDPQYTLDYRPHPISVPAWGCFTAQGPGYMCMFEGSMNASMYRDILRDYLLPTVDDHFHSRENWWFLHDNDPARHGANVVKAWLHNNWVRPLDFPTYSPDLNPIENLWADLKRRMESQQAATQKDLEELLQQEWAATPVELCNKLARSMPRRIQQVIDKRGAYTDY